MPWWRGWAPLVAWLTLGLTLLFVLARLVFARHAYAGAWLEMIGIALTLQLNWREERRGLGRLHRQMHWVYGGYVVLSIVAFAALTIVYAAAALRSGVTA